MVNIQNATTLIDEFYNLLGLTRNSELDVLIILPITIILLFIFEAVMRAFVSILFEPFKQ